MSRLLYLGVIFLAVSLGACAPTVLVPELDYTPHEELEAQYPNCEPQIDALAEAGAMVPMQTALNLAWCYRARFNVCNDEYQVFDVQYKVLQSDSASEKNNISD